MEEITKRIKTEELRKLMKKKQTDEAELGHKMAELQETLKEDASIYGCPKDMDVRIGNFTQSKLEGVN